MEWGRIQGSVALAKRPQPRVSSTIETLRQAGHLMYLYELSA